MHLGNSIFLKNHVYLYFIDYLSLKVIHMLIERVKINPILDEIFSHCTFFSFFERPICYIVNQDK